MNEFDAPVRQDGEMATVDLAGVIDGGADAALDAASREVRRARRARSRWTSQRSTTSTAPASPWSRCWPRRGGDGRPVVAWGLTDHYREIFEITRLADFLEVVADEPLRRRRRHTR